MSSNVCVLPPDVSNAMKNVRPLEPSFGYIVSQGVPPERFFVEGTPVPSKLIQHRVKFCRIGVRLFAVEKIPPFRLVTLADVVKKYGEDTVLSASVFSSIRDTYATKGGNIIRRAATEKEVEAYIKAETALTVWRVKTDIAFFFLEKKTETQFVRRLETTVEDTVRQINKLKDTVIPALQHKHRTLTETLTVLKNTNT